MGYRSVYSVPPWFKTEISTRLQSKVRLAAGVTGAATTGGPALEATPSSAENRAKKSAPLSRRAFLKTNGGLYPRDW